MGADNYQESKILGTPHQRIISRIYQATLTSPPLEEAFRSWLEAIEKVRGPLERKKKLSRLHLEAMLPGAVDADVNRLIYSVEIYLCVQALAVLDQLDQRIEFKEEVDAILTQAKEIRDLLATACPQSLTEIESLSFEFYDSRERLLSTPIVDEFQAMRMSLMPREIRHSLGAFYTPQWLATHVLNESGYEHRVEGFWEKSLLDPSAGSGVFLTAAAEQLRLAVVDGRIEAKEAVQAISKNFFAIEVELVPCVQIIANLSLAIEAFLDATNEGSVTLSANVQNKDALEKLDSIEPVDLVIGNPPWVNWEYMPDEFKKLHAGLWVELGIFEREGKTLAFSKEDISALFVAHSVDRYLKPTGSLAFIVPESLLKSTKNHSGFRKFSVGIFPQPYCIESVEDFVAIRPFEGVANRTIVIYGSNSKETTYPVPYRIWHKISLASRKSSLSTSPIEGVREDLMAQPASSLDLTSAWSTGTREQLEIFRELEGENAYRGRTGLFTGGANAVYHLAVDSPANGTNIKVRNITERAKRTAPQVSAELETEFIYPFLRGRDLSQWNSQVEIATLLPHTADTKMKPVAEDVMRSVAPKTLEYLSDFRDVLSERRGFSAWEKPFLDTGFYACQRVGDYTFSDWKVGWKYISKEFTTDIIGPMSAFGLGEKPVIPNEKVMFVACASKEEAFYLGGIFASALIRTQVESRMVSTQVSPGIISGLNIPKFDESSVLHLSISNLCSRAYKESKDLRMPLETLRELEVAVGKIWNIPTEIALSVYEINPLGLGK